MTDTQEEGMFERRPGYEYRPLYTRPSEQAVTNEMVDAAYEKVRRMPASVDTADGDLDAIIRSALKAAMEAGG